MGFVSASRMIRENKNTSHPTKGKRNQRWQLAFWVSCFCVIILFSDFAPLNMNTELRRPSLSALSSAISGPRQTFANAPHPEVMQTDDPKCLSRTQQTVFKSKTRLPPMSDSLARAWQRYTELHSSCSSGKNWTNVFLNGKDSCKYLIFHESRAGLGNNILSLVTAFLYALSTDRILLIPDRTKFVKLLCDPFPASTWLLPEDFPYHEAVKDSAPLLGALIERQFNSNVAHLFLDHVQSPGDKQFFCEEIQTSLVNVRWVSWTSNQYYVTMLFMMPSFWKRLVPLFPNVSDVFTQLSHLLILPANDVWALIVREYRSYLSGAATKLGVQVRLHGRHDLAAFDKNAFDMVFHCLVSHDLLPNITESDNFSQISSLCNRKIEAGCEDHQPSADIAVLLVSLQGRYFKVMKDLYSQYPTVDGKMVRVHFVSEEGRQNSGLHQSRLALAEMWLLSYADHLVTSPYSTFGYTAQGLGARRPYILNLMNMTGQEAQSSCFLGQSVAPCTHYPQRPPCLVANLNTEHKDWIRRHVRPCQDHQGGLQLVDGFVEAPESTEMHIFA